MSVFLIGANGEAVGMIGIIGIADFPVEIFLARTFASRSRSWIRLGLSNNSCISFQYVGNVNSDLVIRLDWGPKSPFRISEMQPRQKGYFPAVDC